MTSVCLARAKHLQCAELFSIYGYAGGNCSACMYSSHVASRVLYRRSVHNCRLTRPVRIQARPPVIHHACSSMECFRACAT
jgi:hypothetical protein